MATIAAHRESGIKYIVLGGGVRMFSPTAPIPTKSVAGTATKPVPVMMALVCDAEGSLVWFRSDELLVLETDGAAPAAILMKDSPFR